MAGTASPGPGGDNLDALREALRLTPNNVPLRQHLADSLLSAGRAAEAEKEYREALAQSPDHPALQLGLARAFHALLGLASLITGLLAKDNEVNSLAAFDAVLGIFAIGAMLSPWVANGLMLARPKR